MGVGAGVGTAIVVFLIIIIVIWVYTYYMDRQQKALDMGCIPASASDSFGFVTIWNCPVGAKP